VEGGQQWITLQCAKCEQETQEGCSVDFWPV